MGNSCCQLIRRCFSQEVQEIWDDELTNLKFLDNRDGYFSKEELEVLSGKYPEWSKELQEKLIEQIQGKAAAELVKKAKKIKWKEGEVIGHGSFGRVICALNLGTGEIMAVKQVHIENLQSSTVKERIRALELEVELLSNLKHKNIVRYIGTAKTKTTLNIFLEYISGGTIASLINKYGKLNETLIRIYATQILEGLEYLHFTGTIHRDIKGANLLVDNHGVCKLADFGSAKRLHSLRGGDNLCSLKGTANWMAPEAIMQKDLSRFSDIWSLGCTIIEMATGRPPWSDCPNQISTMYQIAQNKKSPAIPADLSPECIDFLRLCLRRNPRERPNVTRLLQHKFITHIDIHARNPGKSTPYLGNLTNLSEKPQIVVNATDKAKISKFFDLTPKNPVNKSILVDSKSHLTPKSNKNQDSQNNLGIDSSPQFFSQKSEAAALIKNDISSQIKLNSSVEYLSSKGSPLTIPVVSQIKGLEDSNANPVPKRLSITKPKDGSEKVSSDLRPLGANIKSNNFMVSSQDDEGGSPIQLKKVATTLNNNIRLDDQSSSPGSKEDRRLSIKENNQGVLPQLIKNNSEILNGCEDSSLIKIRSEDLPTKMGARIQSAAHFLTLNLADQSLQNSFDVLQSNPLEKIEDSSVTLDNNLEDSHINNI